jgi:hypothetical protein
MVMGVAFGCVRGWWFVNLGSFSFESMLLLLHLLLGHLWLWKKQMEKDVRLW